MIEREETVLPYDLYHRIRISSEEHGGIGRGHYFDSFEEDGTQGEPFCAHGHAWGTCNRMNEWVAAGHIWPNPELNPFIRITDNDDALTSAGVPPRVRIPFAHWCAILNVKCGPKPETSSFVAALSVLGED